MRRHLLAAAAILALATACSTGAPVTTPDAPADVVVGSFEFPESRLLAEIYAQALEDEGVRVGRELGVGPRELVLPALREGLVDVVPEYAGSALDATAPDGAPPEGQVEDVVAALRSHLARWDLVVLEPAAASNRNEIVVEAAFAARRGVRSIPDLAPIAGELVVGGPAECPQRPRCLPGLQDRYGIEPRGFVALEDADQVVQALADDVIDIGVLFTTDAVLADRDLVVLDDVAGLQPPDPVVPVGRRAALDDPVVRRALDEVSRALTTDGLRFLNWRIAQPGADLAAEARGWLVRRGLVEA